MPAGPELPPLNPFAVELRRAAAGAAAPDKAPPLRELSSISGVGRSAIGDWLTGKSLPRSWDDSAMPVVDAIIKVADRYGKRFPDEEAVRQRCKDAYESAKSAQQANGTSGSDAPVLGIDVTVVRAEAASPCAADNGPKPVGSIQEPGSATSSVRRGRAKYAVSAVAIFTILIVAVALILLLHPTSLVGSVQAASGCLDRIGGTSWGAGEIHVCASGGQGSYSGYTTDKEGDGHCVRWRIDWDNKPDSHTPWACPQGGTTKFNFNAPAGVSGVKNAFLERVQVLSETM